MAPGKPKSVLVTGCTAGGIGAAIAEVFSEKGYHVFATARTPSKISEKLSSAKNVTVLTLDVLSSESIAAAVEGVTKETGGTLDVLYNNSGSGNIITGLDVNIEEEKKVFDVNFWAPLAMLQAFAPLLIKAKGCVVNQASSSGYIPLTLMSTYNASKAALIAGSETWRRELQPLGVRTLAIATTGVASDAREGGPKPYVPESSYYYGIKDFIIGFQKAVKQTATVTPRQYAISVIREIEKGANGTIWGGTQASMAKWAFFFSPQSIMDMLVENIVPFGAEMAKLEKTKPVSK